MNIAIKCRREQTEAVVLLLGVLLSDNRPTNILEKVIYDIVLKTFQKLRNKTESSMYPRSGWSISLTQQEALALSVFYQSVYIDEESYVYETIQLQRIMELIDLKYGNFNQIDHGNRKLAP